MLFIISIVLSQFNSYTGFGENIRIDTDDLIVLDYSSQDLKMVITGNSLFARMTHTTDWGVDTLDNMPPSCGSKNICYYLWHNLCPNKAQYDRWDSQTYTFNESGSWVDSTNSVNWDDRNDRDEGSETRFSITANASFKFGWRLDLHEKLNVIYRTDTDGEDTVTVAVDGGDSQIQVDSSGAWTEANGYAFSMKEVDQGAGYGNTIMQKRLRFKRVVTSGTDSITISKGSQAERLLYWGTERYNGYTLFIINVARGGHRISQLDDYWLDDVIDREPDIVIFQLPLFNESNQADEINEVRNNVHDHLWGDRSGSETNNNYFYRSDSLENFDLLCVIPHYRMRYFLENTSTFADTLEGGSPETPKNMYNEVYNLFTSHERKNLNSIYLLDMGTISLIRAIREDYTYYNFFEGSGHTGSTFTNDDTHQNNKGTHVYINNLIPLFEIRN
jgi:hypothetical protein